MLRTSGCLSRRSFPGRCSRQTSSPRQVDAPTEETHAPASPISTAAGQHSVGTRHSKTVEGLVTSLVKPSAQEQYDAALLERPEPACQRNTPRPCRPGKGPGVPGHGPGPRGSTRPKTCWRKSSRERTLKDIQTGARMAGRRGGAASAPRRSSNTEGPTSPRNWPAQTQADAPAPTVSVTTQRKATRLPRRCVRRSRKQSAPGRSPRWNRLFR